MVQLIRCPLETLDDTELTVCDPMARVALEPEALLVEEGLTSGLLGDQGEDEMGLVLKHL